MRYPTVRPLLVLLALPAVAACTPNDSGLGGSLRTSYAQQVINPDPHYEGTVMAGGNGQKAAAAVERYRTDRVKQPKSIRTTSGIGKGGGSGGN